MGRLISLIGKYERTVQAHDEWEQEQMKQQLTETSLYRPIFVGGTCG